MPRLRMRKAAAAEVMPFSDRDVKVVRFSDGTIVMGALTMQGLAELSLTHRTGEYAKGTKNLKVSSLGDGSVFMVQFKFQ